MAPRANVADIARRNDILPPQLYAWRREARERMESDDGPAFVPAMVEEPKAQRTRVIRSGQATAYPKGEATAFILSSPLLPFLRPQFRSTATIMMFLADTILAAPVSGFAVLASNGSTCSTSKVTSASAATGRPRFADSLIENDVRSCRFGGRLPSTLKAILPKQDFPVSASPYQPPPAGTTIALTVTVLP